MTTTAWPLLAEAHEALLNAVKGVGDDQWQLPTPCDQWTVTQVLQHAAGDQLAYAAALTGGEGPADNPFAPSGTLLVNPVAHLTAATEAAAEAWASVADDAAAVPVPVPPNTLDAVTGVGACALDAAVHAWDIAKATGQGQPLGEDAAGAILIAAKQIVEPLRAWGAYAPALEPQPGDDAVAALLRYLGRDPEWTA
ncbi:TIGR03086 family metal-binding protein [Glycomyces luteolus]|uniref:TIGR03086 family metal-binding protein n=1 Tax=Glycomyces luteolus TaxID=2670330 RepID=A0A9X3P9P0_9ACTN|nr:TIGR03086 family metal-binding protein [Glycomyces luteolus]MDA1359498.1 TIGR03086 family metal-binding protein [Glycomyces luteolus]